MIEARLAQLSPPAPEELTGSRHRACLRARHLLEAGVFSEKTVVRALDELWSAAS